MTEIKSMPVLTEDNVVTFDEPKDMGMVLASLYNNGTSWLFICGAETLRMQQPIKLTLGLRGIPRPVLEVECTPRYQSPGAMGCEVRFEETEEGCAAIDALLTVIAAAREGGGAAAPSSTAGEQPAHLFDTGESTAPDVEFSNIVRADEPTRKIQSEDRGEEEGPAQEAAPAAAPEKPEEEAADTRRGALSYRVTALHGIDQLLGLSGGIEAPTPVGASEGKGEETSHLLLTFLEFIGMKQFTGVVTIEWKDARPVESTVLTIRKGDLIKLEDHGEDQPDAEEAFLLFLEKEKAIMKDDAEKVRQRREEGGKSVGNLLFEGGFLGLDRISANMRCHKEEAFFNLLSCEGAGTAWARPKKKIKGHPIRVNTSRGCILWVRKILLEQYRRNLDPYLAERMQAYPEVNQEATRYPLMWLLKAQKEVKTAETVLTGAIMAQDCFDMAPVSQHDLARLFFVLTRYGALEWRDLPKTTDDNRILTPEQQLEMHLAHLRKSNPFTRLGVHWATHPSDIETKYVAICRQYAPEARRARHSDRTRALCREISDLLKTSSELLMDKSSRIEERARIVEESQGAFAAQFMEKQARIIRFRGETELACKTLEMAIEISPDSKWSALLKAWRRTQK